ncbi:hypothetical protein [Sporomusa carbonis]|uniref:hypothetical protein n=1 Tax=Sporomusa carbonis TaxID=3076075 RepID=UPI003C7C3A9E
MKNPNRLKNLLGFFALFLIACPGMLMLSQPNRGVEAATGSTPKYKTATGVHEKANTEPQNKTWKLPLQPNTHCR